VSVPLAVIEDIIDASGIAPAIEDMLPAGVRGRQLSLLFNPCCSSCLESLVLPGVSW